MPTLLTQELYLKNRYHRRISKNKAPLKQGRESPSSEGIHLSEDLEPSDKSGIYVIEIELHAWTGFQGQFISFHFALGEIEAGEQKTFAQDLIASQEQEPVLVPTLL